MYEIFYITLVAMMVFVAGLIGYLGYKLIPPTIRFIKSFIRWNWYE